MSPEDAQKNSKLYYLLDSNHDEWIYSDSDYLSYITPHIIIEKIISLSKEHFHGLNDKVIWDMFAGIGCDGLRLSTHSGKVICTEIKDETYEDLVKNTEKFGVNVETHNTDCCKKANDIRCNVIYFDPPWGETFKSGENFDFNDVILNDGTLVMDLLKQVASKYDMLIIKSPISSTSFEDALSEYEDNMLIFTFTQQKLKFLLINKTEKNID